MHMIVQMAKINYKYLLVYQKGNYECKKMLFGSRIVTV